MSPDTPEPAGAGPREKPGAMAGKGNIGEVLPRIVELRDGHSVTVRMIHPDDKEALRAAFLRLSADARYTRFLAPLRQLSDQALESATHMEPGRELALVAVTGDGASATIVGGARYAAAATDGTCEFAITIADEWQGRGLARPLLTILLSAAAARGCRCMEGYVLASNTPMRRLAARLGFADERVPDEWSLRRVSLALDRGRRDAEPA